MMVTVEQWLGKDNILGIDIWNKKYRNGDESFDHWLDRVSGGDKKVKRLILSKKFLFGGRILSNRGLENNASRSNCYVLTVNDSITDIYNTARDCAMTYKAGGGVGIDISALAPAGAKVNNPAKTSSGAVSFIDLFTTTTGLIGQNGRRGALMVSISCDHPDVQKFIELKTDINKATTANLSIRVTDEFMRAVKENKAWTASFTRKETGEVITKVFPADELFTLFCNANYDYGEPGLLFWDTMCTGNMLDTYPNFKYAGVNPCVKGDTLLLTNKGYVQIKDVVGQKVTIWNGYEWSEVEPRITGYDQPMSHVEFSDGSSLDCTDYHKFILKDGSRVECNALNIGDKLIKCDMPIINSDSCVVDYAKAYTNGFYSGDGYFPKDKSSPRLCLYGVKKELAPIFESTGYSEPNSDKIYVYLKEDGYLGDEWDKEFVPDTKYSVGTRLAWLSGLIDSDGAINDKSGSINVSSISKSFLMKVKLMLTTVGVTSTLELMKKACKKEMPDGKGGYKEYDCMDCYRLVISASNVAKLLLIGMLTYRVRPNPIPARCASRYISIKSISKIDNEPIVYCLTEPKNHSMIVNGIITAQCGELPLPDGGACLLGSMNLAEYADWDGTFDFDSFEDDVRVAVNALDEVQDEGIQYHPLDIQKKTAKDWKQLGLGIMGLGDALIKMNVKYGSQESLDICNMIATTLARAGMEESVYLGTIKGNFPKFNPKQTEKSSFWRAHAGESVCQGLRNSQIFAIAPTGSISTMIGVTGGIEPLFALEYDRTTKSLDGRDNTYKVTPPIVQMARDKGCIDGLVCAKDIHYKQRIDMQSVWQSHIDGSISSTINLPHDFPKNEVGNLYMYAWEKKLKGVTVFRDGCKREGILTTKKELKDDELIGVRKKITTGCGTLWLNAFKDGDGHIREIYLSKGSSGGCEKSLIGLSRTISLALRNGVSLVDVVDQLNSCGSCPSYAVRTAVHHDTSPGSCCPSAVGRALLEIEGKAPIKTSVTNKCPECGAELIYENGCVNCRECGYTKCN